MKLGYEYFNATKDVSPFTEDWVKAMDLIISTIQYQQQSTFDMISNPQYQ